MILVHYRAKWKFQNVGNKQHLHVCTYLPSIDREIKLSKVMNRGPIWFPSAHKVAMHSSNIRDWGGTEPGVQSKNKNKNNMRERVEERGQEQGEKEVEG